MTSPDPERWDVAVAVSDAFLDEVNADRISALLVQVLEGEAVEDGAGLSIEIADDELLTELNDGRREVLRAGMSYQVGDGVGAHRSQSDGGAKLFIVD